MVQHRKYDILPNCLYLTKDQKVFLFCFLFLLVNQPLRQTKMLTLDNSFQNILYFHKSAHSKYVTVKVNKGYTWCRFGKDESYGCLQVCKGVELKLHERRTTYTPTHHTFTSASLNTALNSRSRHKLRFAELSNMDMLFRNTELC